MSRRQLTWKPGFSPSRMPTRRPAPRGTGGNRKHGFEFILEYPARAQPAKRFPSVSDCSDRTPPATGATPQHPFGDNIAKENESSSGSSPSISIDHHTTFTTTSLSSEDDSILEIRELGTSYWPDSFSDEIRSSSSALPKSPGSELGTVDSSPVKAMMSNFVGVTASPLISLPPAIEYSSLTERYKPILERYNNEFCNIPLTFLLRINPFRYRTDLDPEPTFLVHAVMALAGHHMEDVSALSHRHVSLGLLRRNLGAFNDTETAYSLLDTIVILFSLDETQSILGSWNTHLEGAYSLIEACGGIQNFPLSSRIEAQIGILVWWDAITSLLSREDCVFPYSYFDAILSAQHKREWDFFGLCGCPTSLVKIVMQVTHLNPDFRERKTTLDNLVLSNIEQSLKTWRHVPNISTLETEENMHRNQDVMHCSQAWLKGLRLYMYRVFHWKIGTRPPVNILQCAREVMDHIIACRNTEMVSRQALLPLFFAGCELRDPSSRTQISRLCSHWDERTKYHMFGSTIPLLKEIWAKQETDGFENVWWGQVVDKQHSSESYPVPLRLCFG